MENNRDKAFPCGDKLHKPATERLTDGNNLSFIRRNPMPNHQRMIPRLFNLLLQKTVFQCMLCDNGFIHASLIFVQRYSSTPEHALKIPLFRGFEDLADEERRPGDRRRHDIPDAFENACRESTHTGSCDVEIVP